MCVQSPVLSRRSSSSFLLLQAVPALPGGVEFPCVRGFCISLNACFTYRDGVQVLLLKHFLFIAVLLLN